MRTAVARLARGESASLPFRLEHHLVAAAYGLDPRVVAGWPADLYLDAVRMLPVHRVRTFPVKRDG